MNEVPSITDWLQAGSATFTALISVLLLYQLLLARKQLRLTQQQSEKETTWNRLNATFSFINGDAYDARERELATALAPLSVRIMQTTEPLPEPLIRAIFDDDITYWSTKRFLNLLEDWATAIRVGAVDPETAYGMISGQIMRYFEVFEPYVKYYRAFSGDDEYYIEFEKLYLEWKARFERNKEANALEMEEVRRVAEAQITAAHKLIQAKKGVSKKY